MLVLVVNAGSSSLKYQLLNMDDESVLAKGNCDRIGIDGHISHKTADGRKVDEDCSFPTHTEAFEKLVEVLTSGEGKVIDSMSEIKAVGHRIVQGAEVFSETTLVTDEVIDKIDGLAELAPVHNHPHALALRACKKVIPADCPQVVVFDTAFHQTMPPKAYMYALPYEYYKNYGIRKYGFHGTSHKYVSQKAAEFLGKPAEDLKIVTCHLGNGSSITAVDGGKCIDTSMGFTPLDGVPMGTRTGSMDPAVVTYLINQKGMSAKDVDALMNKESGVSGVSGVSSDFRDLSAAAKEGNDRAQLALDMFSYQVKKDIGAYAAAMGGVDAVVFTAGVGENDAATRSAVVEGLDFMGIKINEDKNAARGTVDISADDATVKTLVIPTNEELMIAIDTKRLVENK